MKEAVHEDFIRKKVPFPFLADLQGRPSFPRVSGSPTGADPERPDREHRGSPRLRSGLSFLVPVLSGNDPEVFRRMAVGWKTDESRRRDRPGKPVGCGLRSPADFWRA